MERPTARVRIAKRRAPLVPDLDVGRRLRAASCATLAGSSSSAAATKSTNASSTARTPRSHDGGDGCTKDVNGEKIMVLVDECGLPVVIYISSARPHESRMVQRLFDFLLSTENTHCVISDKSYDSDKLDEELATEGIEMIEPHRKNPNRENVAQEKHLLRRYIRLWAVQRKIDWIQHYRRLCIHREKSTLSLKGFIHFGCTMLLIKEVMGWVLGVRTINMQEYRNIRHYEEICNSRIDCIGSIVITSINSFNKC